MTTQTGFKQDLLGSYIEKDPGATLIYSLDWSDWLETNDNIASSTMAVGVISGASNVTVVSQGITNGQITYAELSGGTAGNVYTVTNTITTDNGAIDVRRFRLKIVERYL